jgi:SAM-dependent methyltransferase
VTDGFDKKTLEFYSGSAETYLAARPDTISRHLRDFLKRLTPHASILELGCGAGRDSEAMMSAGFQVDPTDGVPEIAQIASRRLGRDVRVMRFDELDASNEYDAVWANASLLHVPRRNLPDVLARVFQALKPGGLHFASFKAGEAEGRDERDRFYNYLTRPEMLSLYARSAAWENISTVEYVGGGGYEVKEDPWLAITVRKPR